MLYVTEHLPLWVPFFASYFILFIYGKRREPFPLVLSMHLLIALMPVLSAFPGVDSAVLYPCFSPSISTAT